MVGWTSGKRVEIAYAVALVASLVVLLVTGAAWALLLLSIVAVAHSLPSRGAVIGTTVSRFLIATVAVLMAYQIESVVAWLCHVHGTPALYVAVAALGAGVLWVVSRRRGSTSALTFGRQDVVLLMPAVLLAGVYLARVILPSEVDTRSMIRATSMALDDTSHMAMFNAVVRNDTNWLIDVPGVMAIPSHASYPLGWHISTAVVVASFVPSAGSSHMDDFVVLYFFAKVLSLVLIILGLTTLTFRVASHFGFSSSRFWPTVGLYTAVGYTTVLLALPQFLEGFYSFLGLMVYTVLFVQLVIDAWHKHDRRFGVADVVMLLCVASSGLTWLLTAPALLVTYMIVKLRQATTLRRIPWASWLGAAVVGMSFLFQAWDVARSTGSAIENLAAPGGINAPEPTLLFMLLLVLVLLAGMKRFAAVTSPLFLSALPLLLTGAAILGYIGTRSQTISYYFLKFEFIMLLILLPLALVGVMHALRNTVGELSKGWRSAAQYLAMVTVLVLAIPSVIGYGYVQNIGYMSIGYTLTRTDAAILDDELAHTFSASNKRYFFFFASRSRTIMASHLARTMYPNTHCDGEMFQAQYTADPVAMNTTLLQCIGQFKEVVIYTEPAVSAQLQGAISPSLLQSRQVEIEVEPA